MYLGETNGNLSETKFSTLSQIEKTFTWYEKKFLIISNFYLDYQRAKQSYSKWAHKCSFWVFFSDNENQEFAERIPKDTFLSLPSLQLGVHDAVSNFNIGMTQSVLTQAYN